MRADYLLKFLEEKLKKNPYARVYIAKPDDEYEIKGEVNTLVCVDSRNPIGDQYDTIILGHT